ncbi:MAG: right-handed parallel beta-helix repeat-containing protein, partial [Planctomycetales bacterium]|nr:right-handed parallel beta-helix repeat-containing protein [Planctomycetales bacterium]
GLWISHNKTYRDYDEAARQWRDFDTPNVAQVVNCTMDRNNYGLYLQDCTESTIRMADSPIRENRSAGLYVNSSRFVFNPESMQRMFQMENNQNFIYAGNGEYVFENLQVTDAKGYGLHTWYSAVTLRNCDFARNGNTGYYSYYDKSVDAQACRFHENRSFGLRVYCDGRYYDSGQGEWLKNDGPLKFIQCDIANNNHGVHIEGASLPMIQFVDTPIHGNENYGLYAIKCELNFNRTTMAQNWKLYDNGYHIVAGYGKYNFRNLDFSDAKRCGVSTHYSEVTVKNCQFERNEYYGLQSYYNKSFEIEDSRINENGSYGLLLYHGKYYGLVDEKWDWYPTTTVATIRNTPIENSKSYGLYIENCTEDSVSVVNSPIRGNGSAGLYAVRSKFEFSPRTLGDKWQLSDNGSHIYAAWGTYVFKDLNLTGAPSYGAATWGSDVTVSNCSFSGNGSYGFQSHYNNPCLIENSQFDNNRWAGITFRNEYTDGQGVQHAGPIEMRNCSISGNHVGIYLPNSRTDMNP